MHHHYLPHTHTCSELYLLNCPMFVHFTGMNCCNSVSCGLMQCAPSQCSFLSFFLSLSRLIVRCRESTRLHLTCTYGSRWNFVPLFACNSGNGEKAAAAGEMILYLGTKEACTNASYLVTGLGEQCEGYSELICPLHPSFFFYIRFIISLLVFVFFF